MPGYDQKDEYSPCPWGHNLGMATSILENDLYRHSKIFGRIWVTGLGSLVVKIQPKRLESAQLNAARAITGHLRSTPGEFVLKEAHLNSLEARYKTLSLFKAVSWLQRANTDPWRLTFDRQAP